MKSHGGQSNQPRITVVVATTSRQCPITVAAKGSDGIYSERCSIHLTVRIVMARTREVRVLAKVEHQLLISQHGLANMRTATQHIDGHGDQHMLEHILL